MAAVLLLSTIALASAVSEAFYRISSEIDHAQSAIFPSEILIEILNPKPPATHWYSVTIESHNRYSGRAKLLGTAPHPSDAAFLQSDSLVFMEASIQRRIQHYSTRTPGTPKRK
jgi:hypothetical protein